MSRFTVYQMPLEYPVDGSWNVPNTPAPLATWSDADNGQLLPGNNRDAHGVTATRHERYLHQFDRVRNNVEVFDVAAFPARAGTYWLTTTDGREPDGTNGGTACGTTAGATTSNDPTPDLLDLSPSGERIYVALRGPVPGTIAHAAAGSCPGLGVVKLSGGGRHGRLVHVLGTNVPSFGGARNLSDPHAVVVRRIR
ncbi:hypothetical protein L6R52_40940 [Myxococcota bacterium]|nr:hypothetical protein [Myxococcota bacterium]